jgi:NAD(P)-dependent dehydrogenase (short-subunit alcohol dehydrogenase family)
MRVVRTVSTIAGLAAGALAASAALGRRRRESLVGQRVLVTGGSRGLGFLLAREFGRRGARVAICARDEGELAEAVEELRRDGIVVMSIACDVADRAAVEHMVLRVREGLGGVDILVNNAGVISVAPIEAVRVEEFEQALGVMLWGMVYTTLALLPEMRARRHGRIVNVTSFGGRVGVPHLLPYSTAKFAAVGFSESLHAELASQGISVLTVTPGLMRTGSHFQARFGGRQEEEFTWFAVGATLPGVSMDAERAARAIVDATMRGASDLVLTIPARIATAFHGLFPGTTARVLGVVDRLLPKADGASPARAPGWEVAERVASPVLRAVTTLGRTAADRFQHGLAKR